MKKKNLQVNRVYWVDLEGFKNRESIPSEEIEAIEKSDDIHTAFKIYAESQFKKSPQSQENHWWDDWGYEMCNDYKYEVYWYEEYQERKQRKEL